MAVNLFQHKKGNTNAQVQQKVSFPGPLELVMLFPDQYLSSVANVINNFIFFDL